MFVGDLILNHWWIVGGRDYPLLKSDHRFQISGEFVEFCQKKSFSLRIQAPPWSRIDGLNPIPGIGL